MRFLLVDGHNVIHAWDDLRALNANRAKRNSARELLLQRLRHYQDMSGERVIVVFDGQQTQLTEEREPGGLQVIYADAGRSADNIIERLTAKYAHEHQLRAATSDGVIRDCLNSYGAEWISPTMLRHLCDTADQDIQREIDRRRSKR